MSDCDFINVPSVDSSGQSKLLNHWEGINGGLGFNPDISLQAVIRRHHPSMALTVTTSNNGTPSASSQLTLQQTPN